MSVLKFVCAAAFGAVAWGAAAQAADIYGGNGGNGGYGGYKDDPAFVPAPSWQGYYIGGNAGWAWSSIDAANNAVILSNNGTVPFRSPGTRGLFGGMQMGYNAQSGNFLYGIEADLGGLDDGASGSFTDPKNASRVLSVKSDPGLYSDLTVRAGFALGNALLYAKGGLALFTGGVQVTDSYDGINQHSGTFTGWTAGGGIEYMLAQNWTVKAEYQYFSFDNGNFSCCISAASGRLEDTVTANTVKVGFNYLVHGQRLPLN